MKNILLTFLLATQCLIAYGQEKLLMSGSFTTPAQTTWLSSPTWTTPQWTWDPAKTTNQARGALASDGLPTRIEQWRSGVMIAVYSHFGSSYTNCNTSYRTSNTTLSGLPATTVNGFLLSSFNGLPGGWQNPEPAAWSGCGPFSNWSEIDNYRLWAPGDTFKVYPAVYSGVKASEWADNIFLGPKVGYSGDSLAVPSNITIEGITQNGIRPVVYDPYSDSSYEFGQGAVYIINSGTSGTNSLLNTFGAYYMGGAANSTAQQAISSAAQSAGIITSAQKTTLDTAFSTGITLTTATASPLSSLTAAVPATWSGGVATLYFNNTIIDFITAQVGDTITVSGFTGGYTGYNGTYTISALGSSSAGNCSVQPSGYCTYISYAHAGTLTSPATGQVGTLIDSSLKGNQSGVMQAAQQIMYSQANCQSVLANALLSAADQGTEQTLTTNAVSSACILASEKTAIDGVWSGSASLSVNQMATRNQENISGLGATNVANVTISNIDFYIDAGAYSSHYVAMIYTNGATNLTLNQMRVHGLAYLDTATGYGGNGMLTTVNDTGDLTMNQTEWFLNGGTAGPQHNMYIESSFADSLSRTFYMYNSWSHDVMNGHTVKSRVPNSVLEGNYFQGVLPSNLGIATATASITSGVMTVSAPIYSTFQTGMVLSGSNVTAGAYIASPGSTTGTWNVSGQSGNAASTTITGSLNIAVSDSAATITSGTMTVNSQIAGHFQTGMVLIGTGVTSGATISAQLTGSPLGGVGTYSVTGQSGNVSATTITGTLTNTNAELYDLDFSNGGNVVVKNNILTKNKSGPYSNGIFISYNAEGLMTSNDLMPRPYSIDYENNTFVAYAATYNGSNPLFPMSFWNELFPGMTQAQAHAVVTGSSVTSVVVDVHGNGYGSSNGPQFLPSVTGSGGGCTGVTYAPTITYDGDSIASIVPTDIGNTCTGVPTLTISGWQTQALVSGSPPCMSNSYDYPYGITGSACGYTSVPAVVAKNVYVGFVGGPPIGIENYMASGGTFGAIQAAQSDLNQDFSLSTLILLDGDTDVIGLPAYSHAAQGGLVRKSVVVCGYTTGVAGACDQ